MEGGDSDWQMMQLLNEDDVQKIISLIPEEDLSADPRAESMVGNGGFDPLDLQEQSCVSPENPNTEYYLNQEMYTDFGWTQPNHFYQQQQQQQHCAPAVTIKTEALDQWATCANSPNPVAMGTSINALDPLPDSPSSWEDYSFDFGPGGSPTDSPGQTYSGNTTPDGQTMNISRHRRSNDPQNKDDVVRKLRRREQNRVAAQRCRNKKKIETEKTFKDFQELQKSHDRLTVEVDYLENERRRLERILQEHLKECTKGKMAANEC